MLDTTTFLAHIKDSKAPKPGSRLFLPQQWQIEVIEKQEDLYYCRVVEGEVMTLLELSACAFASLYYTRSSNTRYVRYQTVYAKHKGSVAAPTAGLHFDEMVLSQLQEKGVQLGFVTLHIGAGTFRPVRVEAIAEHRMHQECFTSVKPYASKSQRQSTWTSSDRGWYNSTS